MMKYERKKDKDYWQMARAFLHDYMPAVRNQSDKSSEAYKQSLNTYLTFLKSEKGIADEKSPSMRFVGQTSKNSWNGFLARSMPRKPLT